MTLAERIADAPAEVGRAYLVPHVWTEGNLLLPIVGEAHFDEDVDPRVPTHWHIDWRFAPVDLFERIAAAPAFIQQRDGDERLVFFPPWLTPQRRPGRCYALVVQMKAQEVRWVETLCVRELPPFDWEGLDWFAMFEARHEEQGLRAAPGCRTCPHRGLPLVGLPVENGVVTCVGHGLTWNVATGALVSRRRR